MSIASGGVGGAQFAGVLNFSGGPVTGAQVGLVNVALGTVAGTQVGVINIAERYESDAPAGLLNLVRQGQLHLDLWTSDIFLSNVGVRFGSKHVYTLVAFGAQSALDGRLARSGYTAGVGSRFSVSEDNWAAIDASATPLRFGDQESSLPEYFDTLPCPAQESGGL